ncbi:MAG: bifunctional 3-deoxy-7-phosphoheptulonate synthase/chorismate mutase type II [Taibaiella sp.]|nr:bifunctional 3-deoxy-7-phosphoheptulonate synthase/chorismate mutase type II [Taibaiella sp.]
MNIHNIWKKKPLIISGPCSAETEEQVLEGARQLAATGLVDIFRAGIWKPRTRPGTFEGVGAIGLPWLQRVKQETRLPVSIEIATAKQVEEALKHDIDVLWIGARTTVNPFSVQEVSDALSGVDIPVFVKNPINADLELWSGAVERLKRAGIDKVGLIHRGFSSYGNHHYRNAPMWHLAIDMKLRYPELPMLNDPSHICGRRDILLPVMQKAVDLDYDGLMIESHIHPDEAWSDAAQQVTAAEFRTLIESVHWRKEKVSSGSLMNTLESLRQQISQLDDELLQILGQRMKLAEQIGKFKKENNITILQAGRWSRILENAVKAGEPLGLSRQFIQNYLDAIHMESINHQKKIMDE